MNLITEEMVNKAFENIEFCGIPDDEYIAKYLDEQATKKVQKLIDALDGIQETYAGMDGFVTETAPEAYQGRIIQQMYEIAKQSLKEFRDD